MDLYLGLEKDEPLPPALGDGSIFTYVEKEGKVAISPDHPFNAIDAVILARVSYMSFDGLVLPTFGSFVRIKEVAPKYLALCQDDEMRFVMGEDVRLMGLLKDSPRFQNLELVGFRTSFSNENTEQFAALTILLPDRTAFVSFRGTDGSLNGWREDFDLGFRGVLPSDRDASAYLREAIRAFSPYVMVRVGGHSKGGNLAAYATATLSPGDKERIKDIWLFDSPGFRRDVFLSLPYQDLKDRIHFYAPNQSIVGMILYNIAPARCVASRRTMFLQHDVYQWGVDGIAFQPSLFEPVSYGIKHMTMDIFEQMGNAQLEQSIDGLFNIVRDERGDHFGDLTKKVWGNAIQSLLLFRKISPENRKPLMEAFLKVYESIRYIVRSDKSRKELAKKALKEKAQEERKDKEKDGQANGR